MPCEVTFADDRMRVRFDRFGREEYALFLKCKRLPEYDIEFHEATETYTITAPARFAEMLGQKSPTRRRKQLPWNPALYDDQHYLCKTALAAKRFAVWSGCGNGKGFTPDTPVLVPGGWKAIGKLVEGDLVIGRDGTPYPVEGVYHRGEQPLYRITFSDGVSVVCDEDHLWNVKSPRDLADGKAWRTMSVRELIASNLRYGENGRSRKWQIPMCEPVQHPAVGLPLHPYILGVLLGDGSLAGGSVTWCKPDEFIAERVAKILPQGAELRSSESESRAKVWRITGLGRNLPNPVLNALRELGLMGKLSHQKFVPTRYLFTSVEDRVSLLQGLMDTDGYINGHSAEFCSTSEELADTVVWLAQSLGGTASKAMRLAPVYTHGGERREGRTAWRVGLQLPPGIEPFSLPRKAKEYSPATRGFGRWIDSIEPIGRGQSVCISVGSPDRLFVVQHHIVTHNTIIGLEWCRQAVAQTHGRVLIVTLNQIVPEWLSEAAKFYGDGLQLFVIQSRAQLREWCAGNVKGWKTGIAIVNYEKFNPDADGQLVSECQLLTGVCLDESSRLKTGGGKQKWAIIKSFKGVEYKLSLTATPAPNDVMEFASQASFLEKLRTEGEIIWTFFTRNPITTEWEVKPHARIAFYEFLASWSIYINKPKRFGWRLDQPDVPPPSYHIEQITPTLEQLEYARQFTASSDGQMSLFASGSPSAIQRAKLSQIAKGFVYHKGSAKRRKGSANRVERIPSRKPEAVASIVSNEVATGSKVIIWTEFDAESDLIAEVLVDRGWNRSQFETLTGKIPKADRPSMIDRFRHGETQVLITRAKLIGFGINLQCASAMVFSGWSDSFESLYQAVRRSYRHGQTESVRVYFPMVDQLETDTFENIQRKGREFERSIEEMEDRYVRLLTAKKAKVTQ